MCVCEREIAKRNKILKKCGFKNNQLLFQFNGTAQCDFGHCRLDLRGGRGTARPTGRVDGKARLLVAAPGILFVPSRINTSFLRPVSFRHN